MNKLGKIKVMLIRSTNGCIASHKACVIGLGLRRIRHVVEVENTPCIHGMINKVSYLLNVQEV